MSAPRAARLTKAQRETLELARSLIRDMAFGWRINELAEHPERVCARITELLGDGYEYVTGKCPDDK